MVNSIVDSVTLDGGPAFGLAVDPVANRLYVAAGSDVKVVNTSTLAVIATVPVQSFATAVAFNPSTNRLYVRTNSVGVPVIDTLTNTIVQTFAVSTIGSNADIDVNPVTNIIYVPIVDEDLIWVAEDPAFVGGRDFGINIQSNGIQLSWSAGRQESGYSILRWAGNDGQTLKTIANLEKGRTSFVDQVDLTDSPYHYALLTLDAAGNPLWLSDIVGVWPSSASTEHAPANFTLRHSAHAYLLGQVGFGVETSWQAPGNQNGYVMAVSFPDDGQEIPLSESDTRSVHVIGEPSCFTLYAGVGENIGNTHSLSAVPLSWAIRNDPSLARQITTRMSKTKTTKAAVPAQPKSTKTTLPAQTTKPSPPKSSPPKSSPPTTGPSTKATKATPSTKPTSPTPSVKSTNPSGSTNSTKPIQATPTQPTQPTKPTQSTKPANTTQSTKVAQPTQSTKPASPTQSTKSSGSTKSTKSTQPKTTAPPQLPKAAKPK